MQSSVGRDNILLLYMNGTGKIKNYLLNNTQYSIIRKPANELYIKILHLLLQSSQLRIFGS